MAQDDYFGSIHKPIMRFDPRTKLLLLITISIFVLGGTGGNSMAIFTPILAIIPFFLLLITKKWKAALTYIVIYGTCYGCSVVLLPLTKGFLNYVLLFACGFFMHFMPGIMMGYFVIVTTTVSEFVASMERMHVTQKIIIPMSVLFRFFPTVLEEIHSISDAMRMRSIRFSFRKPANMLEYRIIPMMNCSLKIGEELSAAALTRGLGAPIKRTNICQIGIHVQDIIITVICIFAYLFYILNRYR